MDEEEKLQVSSFLLRFPRSERCGLRVPLTGIFSGLKPIQSDGWRSYA
jgi:hypothetical protein